jgi:hypothetical protein
MHHQPAGPQREVPKWLLPVATAVIAAAILVLDRFTDFQTAAAALYVAVVLLAGRFLHPRGVVLVAVGCVALGVLSAAVTPPIDERALVHGVTNIAISIAAIVVSANLVVQ